MKNEKINELLNNCIVAGDFPSAVYLVAEKGEIRFANALGLAVKTDEIEIPATLETIYDLASLTKVLVTALLTAKLIENNEVNLNDKIHKFLPEFAHDDKCEISIQDLLTHTSGFEAWKPIYSIAWLNSYIEQIAFKIADEGLVNAPGAKVVYSDFNFILLGAMLEKFCVGTLYSFASKDIFRPLELERTFFNPRYYLREEIAACEFGNEYEKQICLKSEIQFLDPYFEFRENLIWGEVHDGNCYFLSGVSGHAGLFSTATEVFKIALQFLPNSTVLLKPETCNLFKTNFTRNLNEARSVGFELAETKNSTASNALAKNSFGHLGFTGTSLWIEPETERIFILLTNRTHRPLPFVNINSTRRRFHELATEALNAS